MKRLYIFLILVVTTSKLFSIGSRTSWEWGDGVYRYLTPHDWLDGLFAQNHWHAGMFIGVRFTHDGLQGQALGQIYDQNSDSPIAIITGTASRHFLLHQEFKIFDIRLGLNMASIMSNILVDTWGSRFYDSWNHNKYYGAYVPGGTLNGTKRRQIISQAIDLKFRNINYPGAGGDMLRFKGFSWDGSPGDIKDLRCDGLLEYAYEKQGVILWRAPRAKNNNISTPGEDNVDAHNDFHYGEGLQRSELCPKVQENENGNNSNMRPSAPEEPMIAEHTITGDITTDPFTSNAIIHLKIEEPQSDQIFVTALVMQENEAITQSKVLVACANRQIVRFLG